MALLNNPQEVSTSKILKAAGPLDAKITVATLNDRDLIANGDRYHMMEVSVQEDSTKYVLSDENDLTNTGWQKANRSGSYLGLFDPANPPTPPLKDDDDFNFTSGDNYLVDVDGYWNFTTGDQSPDSGGQNTGNLVKGESIIYSINGIWDIVQPTDLVTSVNFKQGDVILKALDINTDPITGLTATQTQQALEELKLITDGLSSGSLYLGSFDPANPPTPPPQDGDTTNFNQGDFFQAIANGSYDFDQAGVGRVVTITTTDVLRFNANEIWDVIPFDEAVKPAGTVEGAIQFRNAAGDKFNANDNLKYTTTQGLYMLFPGGSGGTARTVQGASMGIWEGLSIADEGLYALYDSTGQIGIKLIGGSDVQANFIKPTISFGGGGAKTHAQVSIDTTTKGFLLPRLTTTERETLGALLDGTYAGLKVYDTILKQEQSWDGSEWKSIGGAGWGITGTTLLDDNVIIETPETLAQTNLQIKQSAFEGGDTVYDQKFEINSDGVSKGNNIIGLSGSRIGDANRNAYIRIEQGQDVHIKATDASGVDFSAISIYNDSQISIFSNSLDGRGEIFMFNGGVELSTSNDYFKSLSIRDNRTIGSKVGLVYDSDYSADFIDDSLTNKIYDDSHIGGQIVSPEIKTPTAIEDKFAIIWDDATQKYILGKSGQSFEVQTIVGATGTLTIDFSLGVFVVVNLAGNITDIVFTNPVDGKYQILFVQDATGGRVISFTGFKSIDGTVPDYSVNALAESLIDVTIANGSVYVKGDGNMQTIA